MGAVLGPAMLVWFIAIGILGGIEIGRGPAVLLALDPRWAVTFFFEHGRTAGLVLGAVVLAVTGVEALYADLGHFGRRPITLVWFAVVFPALLLNYFGQGALLLRDPSAAQNPFYLLAPPGLLYPLMGLATIATIIASQALISGAFSLTHQAVQLRYSPRVSIIHTSRAEAGQIYIPEVNTALMIGCLLLVVGFHSASALAAAYGVAVTGTMAITTALFWTIARHRWQWSALRAGAMAGAFLGIDLAFLGANLVKIQHGGWVPLVLAAAVFLLMTTWRRGTMLLNAILSREVTPLDDFLDEVERLKPPRVSGTAVFLTPNIEGTPPLLRHHLRHNKVLHEEVILLTVVTAEVPDVPESERFVTERLTAGFVRVRAVYGFMEKPDIEEIVEACCGVGLIADQADVTYYLGRAWLLPTGPAPMQRWRKRLFSFMARNASSSVDFFGIPHNRVVELGARIEF
jgi:KUP system potassium uptake protein